MASGVCTHSGHEYLLSVPSDDFPAECHGCKKTGTIRQHTIAEQVSTRFSMMVQDVEEHMQAIERLVQGAEWPKQQAG